jgi:type II secretory pathway predicted ATPase ExeA
MEEFRGLLNLEVPGGKLVSFVFFGLPELDVILALDEPLKQRVAVKYRLKSFTPEATDEYIKHRLHIAGSEKALFAAEALRTVHLYSKGIPRLINTICDNALLEGYLTKRARIDRDIVEEVAADFGLSPDTR